MSDCKVQKKVLTVMREIGKWKGTGIPGNVSERSDGMCGWGKIEMDWLVEAENWGRNDGFIF
jgi:hypothetical protein